MIQIAFQRFVHCETDSLCAENIGLKDIARSRRGELISRGELIMYYSTCAGECDKYCEIRQYLDYKNCVCRKKLIDDLIEQCTSIVDIEIKNGTDIFTSSTVTKNIVKPVNSDNSTNIYLFLFVAVLIVAMLVTAGFIYYCRKNSTTKLDNKVYDVAYSGADTLNF